MGDEKVVRLEVAMNDASRVRFRDGLAGLDDETHGLIDLDARGLDSRAKVFALEKLHHDVRRAFTVEPGIQHARNVLTAQLDRGASLAQGQPAALVVVKGFPEQFDGDSAMQLLVGRGVYRAHAPGPQHTLDLIFAENSIAGF
jgi:hypothetical protein